MELGRCANCGYAIQGLPSEARPHCPECGERLDPWFLRTSGYKRSVARGFLWIAYLAAPIMVCPLGFADPALAYMPAAILMSAFFAGKALSSHFFDLGWESHRTWGMVGGLLAGLVYPGSLLSAVILVK